LLRANVSDLLVYEVLPYVYIGDILTLFPARQASLLIFCYLPYQTRLIWFLRKSQDYIQDFIILDSHPIHGNFFTDSFLS